MEHVTAGTCRPRSLPSKAMMDAPWCVVCVSFLRPNVVVTWRRHRAYENSLNMYRKGNMDGPSIEYAWNVCGICMEYAWDMYGTCTDRMEYNWNMYAMHMEYVRNLNGQCMEYAQNI